MKSLRPHLPMNRQSRREARPLWATCPVCWRHWSADFSPQDCGERRTLGNFGGPLCALTVLRDKSRAPRLCEAHQFLLPMHDHKTTEALHEPVVAPRGLGLRQSSGAFPCGPRAQKRQRTAAVQDASATVAVSLRLMAPIHRLKRTGALHDTFPRASSCGTGTSRVRKVRAVENDSEKSEFTCPVVAGVMGLPEGVSRHEKRARKSAGRSR